ncbi:PREDICTED: RAS protein activator like-3 [Calidris pugnax]|uniref:RAS protein activator like-3 n=1 Tax=Calidris pugnax TaxID=198806 RepID=UPI00071E5608|nr:PREDICTED: RAS protein activator like-3 [Calidris pugnax]
MEVETPPEPPTLLKTYKWRTAAPVGDREAEKATGPPGHRATESPGSRRWTRLQGWKRSYSHPESDGHQDGAGRGHSGSGGTPKATPRRSLFQRAFSAPSKGTKEPRGPEGGRATLQKYLRSMSKRKGHGESGGPRAEPVAQEAVPVSTHGTPAPDALVWDVSNFSLVDGHLVLVGRDEEASCRSRTRTGSSISDSTNLHGAGGRRDPGHVLCTRKCARRSCNLHHVLVPSRSGSRESLLPPPSLAELDLTGDNVIVRPVHGSIVGEKFCFQIITGEGSRSFGCTSLAERDRWIENLRRTVQPNKDNCERLELALSLWVYEARDLPPRRRLRCHLHLDGTLFARTTAKGAGPDDSSTTRCVPLVPHHPQDNCERLELALSLWVYEARDLPPRRRLRCHLHLDGTLFARTTAKVAGPDGELFWGELFQLAALPPSRALTLALCRDDHPGQPVASITIPLSELAAARQPLERWYPLSAPAGGERVPSVRVRGRYREVQVLPIVRYKELAEFITFHYRELCARLEPTIAVRHKEELAGALVRVLQSTGKAKSFLIDLGVAELDRFDDREALIFRENTLATKAIDEYMKLVGGKYLQDTLGEAVAQLCTSDDSCEVDPSKCAGLDLSDNQNNLRQVCEETFQRIATSCEAFPAELGEIFAAWQEECAARGKTPIGQRLVSASLFLRFLCPAIMSPSLFGLVQEYPSEATARTLTLVAKVIQNLANFTTFGEKEAYMGFMNEFLEHNWSTMRDFLQSVANPESSVHMATYDGYVDLALELATLHLLLCDIFSSLDQATQEELEPLPTILTAIKEGTPVPVSVRLSSTMERRYRPAESFKPGFVPPRDLSKHSPLIKSQSLISIRRVRGREEGPEPSPAPVPSPPPSSRERRNVQRTQSVPAQNKATRRLRKQSSVEHVERPPTEDNPGTLTHRDAPGRGKIRSSVSLPRKSTVPWQRYAEEAAVAQGELYAIHPLEKHGRLIEGLRKEVGENQEKIRLMEMKVGEMEEQHREQLERLRKQLEEANARAANLGARLTAAEGTRKKDLERLKSSEEKNRELERRLSALEREQAELRGAMAQTLGHPGRTGRRMVARGWDESGDDAQATSV